MSDQSIVEVKRPDPMAALELWFFRDLGDEQRAKLLSLIYGVAPTAEMRSMHVQRQFLRSVLAYSRTAEREACAMVADEAEASCDRATEAADTTELKDKRSFGSDVASDIAAAIRARS